MMRLRQLLGPLVAAALLLVATLNGVAQSPDDITDIPVNPEREAYYGDLHLLTTYSFSAYMAGVRVGPDDAYRFARGEPVNYLGEGLRRSSPPLDFLAVTDQAENMGLFNTLDDPNSLFSKSEIGQWIRKRDTNVLGQIIDLMLFSRQNPLLGVDAAAVKAATQTAWQQEIEAANHHYQPGMFTTFIGFHWTSYSGGKNLHRNVIFRGNNAPLPFSSIDSIKPEDLWTYLDTSRRQGWEALAIPHNSNLSDGLMFDGVDSDGLPITQAYAKRRAAHEPLVEISNLGESETHPALSPNDEFSRFELFGMEKMKKPAGSYVRHALGRGMEIAQHAGGFNPFKFGFVASTDYSNGLSDSAEIAYAGTNRTIDPRKPLAYVDRSVGHPEQSAAYRPGSGSLTGVWAEQNTRKSIFAAFRRKETFGTSGTRLKLRFFASWEYGSALFRRKDWIKEAYRRGVPMGGDLPPRPAGKTAPRFAIWATRDPEGANLDRLQVIKISLENGKSVEKIYDVALSNGRKVDPKKGKAATVGNTVDLQRATYTNTIGATEISAVWQDPQFDPKARAAYYLRVLEIPTPRWSTIEAVKRGQPLPEGVPGTIQERGWSSPVWFVPQQ
ncbi:MAG: DUF3604 domain-containing protein [Acidobacteria bacterium]|nr:DUF3604 domain-containing protein [Acidobacteriota bacterium]